MTETTESAGPDPKRVGGPQGLLAPALLLAFLLVMLAPSMFLAASRLPSPWSLWLGALVSLLLPLNLLLSSALALMGLLVYAGPLIGSRRFDRAEALRSRQGEDRPEWARLPEAAAKGGVAVLIHGTFARKNSWTLPDAPLPQALRASGLTVATFSWTDANSMRSRRIAVERLRRYIGELTAAGFGSVALVGHSHAGNIALKACEEPQTAARVKAIACLSTPFIEAWRPRVRVIHGWAHAGLYLVAACAGGFLMLLPGALLTSLDDAFTPRLLAAELCCVGLATLVGVTGVRIVRQVKLASHGRSLGTDPDVAGSVCSAAAVQALRGRSLILTRAGDEADGVLKLASMLNRQLVSLANRTQAQGLRADVERVEVASGGVFVDLLRGGMAGLLALQASVTSLAFGANGLRDPSGLYFTSSETPPGAWTHVNLSGAGAAAGEGLYHSSLYEDPKAIEIIVAWLHRPGQP